MSQLILNRGNVYKRSLLNKIMDKFQVGPYLVISSLVMFVVLIIVVTLVFSTRQITKGYQLSMLDFKHNNLVTQGEVRSMQISNVRSLRYIQEAPKVKSMISPKSIVYIKGESTIASR